MSRAIRYNRTDLANILANVNAAAGRLGMANAGQLAVETRGGTYLYLTDRSGLDGDHTGPGSRVLDLGSTVHRAADALISYLQALQTVEQSQHLADAVRALPTIHQGHGDDLKAEGNGVKVWVSRMTREDGAATDREITVERFDERTGAWRPAHA